MVTYSVTNMITCSPVTGQLFDTMTEASSDKEWLFNSSKSNGWKPF